MDIPTLSGALRSFGAVLDPIVALFDQLPDGLFWIKDAEGHFRWVNSGFVTVSGWKNREAFIGKTDQDLSEPALASQIQQDDAKVMEGSPIIGRVELLVTGGIPRWYLTSKVACRNRDGRVVGTAGLSIPIDRPDGTGAADSPLSPAIDHIAQNLKSRIRNSSLAKICSMSVAAFQRKFKAAYRCSPHMYVRQVRIRMSCRALAFTQRSIGSIAMEYGFSDQSHYTREFGAMMKETPRAYRLRNRQ